MSCALESSRAATLFSRSATAVDCTTTGGGIVNVVDTGGGGIVYVIVVPAGTGTIKN